RPAGRLRGAGLAQCLGQPAEQPTLAGQPQPVPASLGNQLADQPVTLAGVRLGSGRLHTGLLGALLDDRVGHGVLLWPPWSYTVEVTVPRLTPKWGRSRCARIGVS